MIKRNTYSSGFGGRAESLSRLELIALNFEQHQRMERERIKRAAEFQRTRKIIEDAVRPSPRDIASLADQIIAAGKKRRGELPSPPLSEPPPGSVAARILAAGKRRRGET